MSLPSFLPEGDAPTIWEYEDRRGNLTSWAHATKQQWDNTSEIRREILLMENGGVCFVVRL